MKRVLLFLSLLCAGVSTEAQAQSVSMWYPNAINYVLSSTGGGSSYSAGTKVTFLVSGIITDLVFPKGPTDPTTSRNTSIWSTAGARLASCTTSETASPGSEQSVLCHLATPFSVAANTTYVIGYDIPASMGPNQVHTDAGVCNQAGNAADFTCLAQTWVGAVNSFPSNASSQATFFADFVFVPCSTASSSSGPPQTITAAFLSSNFHQTLSDSFAPGLPTIAPNGSGAFSPSYTWYNGVEQCCMSPTPQPGNVGGQMWPLPVGLNPPFNPYSNTSSSGGLTMTMHTETATDSTHTYTSVFSGVATSIAASGQGFTQEYGYFEATMQVSPNIGTWPAFWMLSPSKNMEIDIIEQYGHDPNHYWGTVSDYNIPVSSTNRAPHEFPSAGLNLTTGFHQYGLLWDANNVSFYLDRSLQWSIPTPQDANQPMYLLFDQGSGSGWPTCAGPSQVGVNPPPSGTSCTGTSSDQTTQLEGAQLLISNISVWQHN